MTNSDMLNRVIMESGMKIAFVAKKVGITREGFYKKINNETEFKASEIITIQKLLNLSNEERDKIFFAQKVE